MSSHPPRTDVLSTQLCPWLEEPYALLEKTLREGRLGHGWLLTGPAGLGKINLALVVANRLLNPGATAPGRLAAAAASTAMTLRHEPSNHHPDLHWLFPEPDKHTITVDQIRQTAAALALTSLGGQAKIVIIEPADALTTAAANALLKTLEEPTLDTYLFLVSHQTGRLTATVRSRCQTLSLPQPRVENSLDWLSEQTGGASRTDWAQLLALAGDSPFRALTLYDNEYHNKNKLFEEKFQLISDNKLDPQSLADDWLKEGIELPVAWLATRLQREIRARMAPKVSNSITDLGFDRLHNAWQALTLQGLFCRLDAAETLLSQLGKGTNADLALRVLLLDFHPRRERT
ncbi:MAG: hypothetical protein V3S94_08690 [Gammaproteobacteria bacterium]